MSNQSRWSVAEIDLVPAFQGPLHRGVRGWLKLALAAQIAGLFAPMQ